MNPDKLPSLASTMAALDRFADELLQEEGLYRITSYGWADQDTIDPEFSGHALWQTEPPFEPDWERIFDGGVPRWTPLPRVEQLMLNGEDFLGAMLMPGDLPESRSAQTGTPIPHPSMTSNFGVMWRLAHYAAASHLIFLLEREHRSLPKEITE